jgi:hypothetical protein
MTTAPTDPGSTKTVNAVGIMSSDLFGDLSADAKQAVSWMFSDNAKKLTAIEARACILEGWGKRVDDELQSYFSPNITSCMRSAPFFNNRKQLKQSKLPIK